MSPGTGRRTRRVVALTATSAMLAAVIGAAAHARLGGDRSTVDPPAEGPAAAEVPAAAPPSAGAMPDDVTWAEVCGLHLPASTQFGPRDTEAGRARGFAHEPAGAVLAALHLTARVSPQTGPHVFVPTLREQVTGPDAAAFADAVHTGYEQTREARQVPYGQPLCPIYASVRGYRLDSYADAAATVRLLIEAPGEGGPRMAAALVALAWLGGDWQLVAPPRGDWATVRTILPSSAAANFTPLPARR